MGIRESLESTPGELNIHDISVEEETREYFFDPEKEITDEDWEKIKNEVEELRKHGAWERFAELILAINTISPEKIAELNISQEDWQGMGRSLSNILGGARGGHREALAEAMKVFFPDKTSVPDDVFGGASLNEIMSRMKSNMHMSLKLSYLDEDWVPYLTSAHDMRIIYPDLFPLSIKDNAWDGIKDLIERNRQTKNWFGFVNMAAYAKILFPARMKEFNIQKDDWQEIRNFLEEYKDKKDWYSFCRKSANAKILAAREVRVSERGTECVMPTGGYKEKKSKRPERRAF